MAQEPNMAGERSGQAAPAPAWREVWQLPVLIAGLALFVAGLWLIRPRSTPFDFTQAAGAVEQQLKDGDFDHAQEAIAAIENHSGSLTPVQQARVAALAGDITYLRQLRAGAHAKENDQRIVDLYEQARKLDPALDGLHLQRLTETQLALGQQDAALETLDALKNQPEARQAAFRQVIEHSLQQSGADPAAQDALLDRYVKEVKELPPGKDRRSGEIWAAGIRMQRLISSGDQDAAIGAVLLEITRLRQTGPDGKTAGDQDLAPLDLLLGQAYQKAGKWAMARQAFEIGQAKLDASDPAQAPLCAAALLGLGQVALNQTSGSDPKAVQAACDLFTKVQTQYPSTPSMVPALIGRATGAALLNDHDRGVEDFALAVKKIKEAAPGSEGQTAALTQAVLSTADAQTTRGQYSAALRYLEALAPLYAGELSADLLLKTAQTHEMLAQQLQNDAGGALSRSGDERPSAREPETTTRPATTDGTTAKPAPVEAQRQMRIEAADHFDKAGDLYVRHARAVTIAEPDAFGSSLWRAANCFDAAHLYKKARPLYAELVQARPDDANRFKATVRQGLGLMDEEQFAAAAELFNQLYSDHPNNPDTFDSLVPLARCRIALKDFDGAKRVLTSVLTDHPTLTPQSAVYRQALTELGKLHHQLGEYTPAIQRFTEAVERYGSTPDGWRLQFGLAEAERLSAGQLALAMAGPNIPESRRQALSSERTRRLQDAQALYAQVVEHFDAARAAAKPKSARAATDLDPADRVLSRNSSFYRADCAYDLGRFEEAITLYDQAAKRWDKDPASLIALVQIVNANCELGRFQDAKIANDRAKEQLKGIPAEAWQDPNLPMSRQHWEDLYRWSDKLKLYDQTAMGPTSNPRGITSIAETQPAGRR